MKQILEVNQAAAFFQQFKILIRVCLGKKNKVEKYNKHNNHLYVVTIHYLHKMCIKYILISNANRVINSKS